MTDEAGQLDEERDSLHILPLATVPLQIPSLQKARIVKNARLEGMIELFSGQGIGSGQIHPNELDKAFDFSGKNRSDLSVVRSLSRLPSYDVYSLRIELRNLGINVEEHAHLRLSASMTAMLSDYMHVFTKPLIGAVYGDSAKNVGSYQDMLKLFMSPDQDVAKRNLHGLAMLLSIRIMEIPTFLQDYGDVYLSLAYYQHCIDDNIEKTTEFFDWLHELQRDPTVRANGEFIRVSKVVEEVIRNTADEVQHTLEMFENRTSDMWENPTAEKFRAMKQLIAEYQSQIGGALCAISVKLDAWARKFRFKGPGGIQRRVEFVMNEMRYGLEQIKRIGYSDAPS